MASLRVLLLAVLQTQLAFAELNVYGKPMTDCGPEHAAGCTYSPMDAGAHEVCVTQLPQGFSSETGQGPWSDQFTGQPWCICIWAYSNYILQNKDLPLKCESVPSKVLEEQYSLDKFKQCGSMSSTQGCGAEDIRRSIESLCQQCDAQAGADQTAKAALKGKCDAILASAPAAALPQLYEKSTMTKGLSQMQNTDGASPQTFLIAVLVISGLALGIVIRTFGGQRETPQQEGDHDQQSCQEDDIDGETRSSLLA